MPTVLIAMHSFTPAMAGVERPWHAGVLYHQDARFAHALLQALREAGVDCASSCEAGVCGTCQVAYRDGTPEHNDLILSEEERASQVLVCCARAREPFSLDI